MIIQYFSRPFSVFQAPIAVYSDRQPFASSDMKYFLKTYGTMHISAPVAAHRSMGKMEKVVDLLQRILKKGYDFWPSIVTNAVNSMNTCIITKLGHSPHETLFGLLSCQRAEKSLPTVK